MVASTLSLLNIYHIKNSGINGDIGIFWLKLIVVYYRLLLLLLDDLEDDIPLDRLELLELLEKLGDELLELLLLMVEEELLLELLRLIVEDLLLRVLLGVW